MVAYALLPRLAGADLTIYPGFDAGYVMSKEACVSVAVASRQSWHHLLPTMPAVGGRMDVDRVANLIAVLGQDTVFVLGSRIQQLERGVVAAIEEFQQALIKPL